MVKFKEWVKEGLIKTLNFLLDKPLLKFITILFVLIGLTILNNVFPETVASIPASIFITGIMSLFVYIILLIIKLVKNSFHKLLNARTIWSLAYSYILFVIGVLLLLSFGFSIIEHQLEMGYLKYGQCQDTFDKTLIKTDPARSDSYLYFSAVTYFTVGYGDICPMGLDKQMALFTMFIGNMVNVIVMVIVINNYINRKQRKEK